MKHVLPAICLAHLLSAFGCATTMYDRPLEPGEAPVDIATIVAVDLLEFDGKKPAGASLNSWKVTPGPHRLMARANWGGLHSTARTAVFSFEQGHDYMVGLRGYNQKTTQTAQGTVQEGDWEIAVYDRTSKCVVVETGPTCHPAPVIPWARGWFWSL